MADDVSAAPDPDYFDAWYAAMADSPRKDELVQRHLGLPPSMLSSSVLGWDGVEEVARALRLEVGQVLLDLGCGRGGYGLELAHRMGCELIGVDFSPVAVRLATEYAERLGRRATFRRGALESTGLDDASVDGIVCVDSIQFTTTPPTTYAELRRVLRPGGRVAITTWEALDPADERLPVRIRDVDLHRGLTAAGFDDVEVHDRPGWLAAERALWEEARSLDPGDDAPLASLKREGEKVLGHFDLWRRVLATAVAPA